MGYNDDWENLMNSVFGPGGRMRAGGVPAGKGREETKPAAKPGAKPAAKPAPRTEAPDLNKALLEQQKTLDKLLKKQNEALRSQDVSTKQALEDSRQLLRDMEADGLLARGAADTPPEHLGSFEGLAAEVKQTVLGQDDYVDALVGNVSVPVYFGLIPSSSAVWADRLPAGAPTADELSWIEEMYFATGASTDAAGNHEGGRNVESTP